MIKSLRRILYTVLVIAVLSNAFIHIREIEKSISLEQKVEKNETVSRFSFQLIGSIFDNYAKIIADLYNRVDVLSKKIVAVKPDFERLMNGTVIIYNEEYVVAGVCIEEDEDFYYILTVQHLLGDRENEISSHIDTVPESNMGLAVKLEKIQQFFQEKALQQFVPSEDITAITVQMRNHTMVAGEFLFVNYDLDLGFLRIYKSERVELEVLKLAEPYPKVGDEVYVLGHPLGRKYNLSKGIVSKTDIDSTYFGIDALTTFGNSGGAVFNNRGEIIGICSMVPVYSFEIEE